MKPIAGAPQAPLPVEHSSPRRGGALHRPRSKNWDRHVEHVEALARTPAFCALRDEVLRLAELQRDDQVLDIGAGTGLLALAAAPRVAHVTAVEISPRMGERLESQRRSAGIENVHTIVASASALPIGAETIDVVVSNYCFHHMGEAEKLRALDEILRVLRPNGRLVLADMMFAVGVVDPRDRAVAWLLVRRLLRKGLPGALRLAKNGLRMLAGRWEHPASIDWWRRALPLAGFAAVEVGALDHEGGIATARKPHPKSTAPDEGLRAG